MRIYFELRYEIGFSSETRTKTKEYEEWEKEDESTRGERPTKFIQHPIEWERCAQKLDDQIQNICAQCYATEPPILYLTEGKNFRNDIAKTKKYKGTRKGQKPFHFDNLTSYMFNQYDVRMQAGL